MAQTVGDGGGRASYRKVKTFEDKSSRSRTKSGITVKRDAMDNINGKRRMRPLKAKTKMTTNKFITRKGK